MSINFPTLKGLTIPEGVVKQIADSAGRVLWSAVKPVTITVKNSSDYNPNSHQDYAKIEHNGIVYTSPTSFEANIGDTIRCEVHIACSGSSGTATVTLNGTEVAKVTGNGYTTKEEDNTVVYEYTVVSDAAIELDYDKASFYGGGWQTGYISIIEIRNDPATITITGDDADGYGYADVTINGITYGSRKYDSTTVSVEVEAGTVIKCSAYCPASGTTGSTYISVNGTKVKTATATGSSISYDYVVTGNTTIRLRSREKYSNVVITET